MIKHERLSKLLKIFMIAGKYPAEWKKSGLESKINEWRSIILERVAQWSDHDFDWVCREIENNADYFPVWSDFHKKKVILENIDREQKRQKRDAVDYEWFPPAITTVNQKSFEIVCRLMDFNYGRQVGESYIDTLGAAHLSGLFGLLMRHYDLRGREFAREQWQRYNPGKPFDYYDIKTKSRLDVIPERLRKFAVEAYNGKQNLPIPERFIDLFELEIKIESLPEKLEEAEAEPLPF